MLPIHNKKGDVTHFIALQKDMTIVKTIGPDPIRKLFLFYFSKFILNFF